jgi:hypothetical protein
MQKTLVYEDNNVCIFKPTNFQESSIIGEPIYSQDRLDEHYKVLSVILTKKKELS